MADQPLILVVDDEAHIVHVVSLKLRNAGYEVLTASDGEEALALAIDRQPDLIITDYQMPFMTGIELCQNLRLHERTASIPALMLTAHGFALSSSHIEKTNIVEIISKPFSPRDILLRTEELIAKRHTAVEPTPESP